MSDSLKRRMERLENLMVEPLEQSYREWFKTNRQTGYRAFRGTHNRDGQPKFTLADICDLLESGDFATEGRQVGNRTAIQHLDMLLEDGVIDSNFYNRCIVHYSA